MTDKKKKMNKSNDCEYLSTDRNTFFYNFLFV